MARKKSKKDAEVKLDVIEPIELDNVETTDLTKEVKNEEIEVIGYDNKPISLLAKGDDKAPKGFVPVFEETKAGKFGCYNGRTFQVLNKETGL